MKRITEEGSHPSRKPMTIDFTKPVRTKDGKPVRILCTDMKNPKYPILGIKTNEDGVEFVLTYTREGFKVVNYPHDKDNLENVPETKYKLVYSDGYIVPQAKWLRSKAQFEVEDFAQLGRVGYLVKTDDNISFEPF